MTCLTPVTITLPYREGESRARYVPCGKCSKCLKSRASSWMIRLMHELHNSPYGGTFVTLTYADHMLPTDCYNNPVLVKRHLQNFFKRLRNELPHKIKYYAVGEYGGLSYRPHYHFIAFNLNHNVAEHYRAIVEAWTSYDPFIARRLPIGNLFFGSVDMGSVAYVTGYVIKPDQHSYADELMIQREFSCMSNGLGLSHLSPDMIDYYRNGYVNYVTMPDSGGKKRALPRYYREKLFTLREPFRQSLPTQEVTGYVYDLDEVYAYAD